MNKQPKRRRNSGEQKHQAALFEWARRVDVRRKYPALRLMSSSLNGVHLTETQSRLAWAAGMTAGVHDITLPVPRGGYTLLSIEMKYGDNTATPDQVAYGEGLMAEGACVAYCWTWEDAREIIEWYLAQPRSTYLKETPPC